MKKTLTLLTILLLVIFMVGCDNAINPIESQTQIDNERTSLAKAAKVDVCHLDDNGEYIIINISENAYQAHLDHGDEMYGWHVGGTWVLDFAGGTANREFRDLVQDAAGNVTGVFWWKPSDTWLHGGPVWGTITGDALHLDYEYAYSDYTGVFDGVIGENVITQGTFSASSGFSTTWTATGQSAFGCEDPCEPVWHVDGTWRLDIFYGSSTIWDETLILIQSGTNITGGSINLTIPTSGAAWTVIDAGSYVDGNSVYIMIDHDNSSKTALFVGTIDSDGSMSGTWSDVVGGTRTGDWETVTGVASLGCE